MPRAPAPGDAATTRAMPGVALHPCHHRAHHRHVDLVVTTVQHVIGFAQRGLAMRAGGRPCGDRFVGKKGQRATAALAIQAALAWSGTLGFLRLVRLLTLRRRQAGIVRFSRDHRAPIRERQSAAPPLQAAGTATGSEYLSRRGSGGRDWEAAARPWLGSTRP
jgi:hypothetical protein